MNNNMIILIMVQLLLLILILLSIIFSINKSKRKIISERNKDRRELLKYKSIISMTCYQIRNYREGQNPYTTMNNIINYYRDEIK